MKVRSLPCLLLAGVLLAAGYANPQNISTPPDTKTPAKKHPKLGLVLEGGGALGLAHIGVIAWMEEHHIPVSYVAGTSMGGLVGGVYATGRSPAEVKDVVETIDWDEVLRGQTPFQNLTFRRKEDARDIPASLQFGLRKGIQLPSGFNSGQQVSMILDNVALPYSEINSFNDLPIPFACVATDLVSGKAHVFHDGSFSLALRSTMSLPGLFTPVRSDDHLFVDGGLLDNLPIGVAKDMGADVVLGVHLETAPLSPDATLSSFGVLGRSLSVMIADNQLRSMEQADLLLTVPLHDFSTMDYNKDEAIIKAGYDAAEAKASILSVFSVDEAEWQRYLAERNARRRTTPVPEFVKVTGTSEQMAKDISEHMSSLVGQPVDPAVLNHDVMNLYGMGRFSNVSYSMTERDGKVGLHIQTEDTPYAPPVVRPYLLIDGSDFRNVLFSVGARITWLDFGSFRSEWRNDVIVGSQYLARSEYYHPFTPRSNWFIAPRVDFSSSDYNLYSSDELIATYLWRRALGGVDVGYGFGTTGEFRMGYEGGWEHLSPDIGSSADFPTTSGGTGDVKVQYRRNTLDRAVSPHSGMDLLMYTKGFHAQPSAPGSFPLSEIQSQTFFPLTDHPSTIFFTASGGSSYGFKTGIPSFSLGGSQYLVAWNTNELLTNQYFLGQLGYTRKLVNLSPLVGTTIDFIGGYELGKTYKIPNGPTPPNLPMDGFGGIIMNTILGPVEVAGAVGSNGRARIFFRVGRIF
jgi:NTE family protein